MCHFLYFLFYPCIFLCFFFIFSFEILFVKSLAIHRERGLVVCDMRVFIFLFDIVPLVCNLFKLSLIPKWAVGYNMLVLTLTQMLSSTITTHTKMCLHPLHLGKPLSHIMYSAIQSNISTLLCLLINSTFKAKLFTNVESI